MPTMASRKGPLSRSPLSLTPINSSTYQESLDLLSNAHEVTEQGQQSPSTLSLLGSSGRHSHSVSSGSRRDFKIKASSSRFSSAFQHSRGPSNGSAASDYHRDDSDALVPRFSHDSHESFDLTGGIGETYDDANRLSPPLYSMGPVSKQQRLRSMEDPMDHSNSYSRHRCARQCCCIVVMIVLILLGLGLLCAHLYHRPKPPTLEIRMLNITSFKYDQGGEGGIRGLPQVGAGLRFVLRITNPNGNRVVLIYNPVEIDLDYRRSRLSSIGIPGFKQHKRNTRALHVEMPGALRPIRDPLDAQKILKEGSRRNIQVDLRGAFRGHYRLWGFKLKKFDVPVDCKLNVRPESDDEDEPAHLISSSCYYYPS